MTYSESEYPVLIQKLVTVAQNTENPFLFCAFLEEIWRVHGRIPLYPGIVGMCMPSVIKLEPDLSGLKAGDRISFKSDGKDMFGVVDKIDKKNVFLKDAYSIGSREDVQVPVESVSDVRKISTDSLEEVWPTLAFRGDEYDR